MTFTAERLLAVLDRAVQDHMIHIKRTIWLAYWTP